MVLKRNTYFSMDLLYIVRVLGQQGKTIINYTILLGLVVMTPMIKCHAFFRYKNTFFI
jgi:hypothetical protein